MILYKFQINDQVEGLSSRAVELLLKVSMLPFTSFALFQHTNTQQLLSPVAYTFSAGGRKESRYE